MPRCTAVRVPPVSGKANLSRDDASRHTLDAIRRYVYPFRCHALSLTSVLHQVTHPSTSTCIECGDHRNTGQASPCSLTSLHSHLRRATSCPVATPRSSLPFGICPYTPTEVTRPLWLTFTASTPSSTLTRQGAMALGFTPSLGRLSNSQATEDDVSPR